MRNCLIILAAAALAADWPRFRGPNGSGIGENAPLSWTERDNRLWTIDLPGTGNGSPIVCGGRLFLQAAAADGSERMLLCYDAASGKELWTYKQAGQPAKAHRKNSLASSTPAADDKRVAACFWDGNAITLAACDLKGRELWTVNLGQFQSDHGAGLSPVLHGNRVFVNFDHELGSELIAFDADSGSRLWSAPRKSFRACYSTPIVRTRPDAAEEIICLSTAGVTAYNPGSGDVLWDSPFNWSGQALRSVASPILANGIIVALTGDGGGARYCVGIEPGDKPKTLWQNKSNKLSPYVPSPIAIDQHVYWITDQGVLQCIDPRTGKSLWTEQIFNSAVSASPVAVGDALLMIDDQGRAITGRVNSTGFEKLASGSAGGPVIATPAIADGRLYVRAGGKLLCIAKP